MQVWNSCDQEAQGISILLLAPSHHDPECPSFPPSSIHAVNWAACPAQPPWGTHTHGTRGNWVMLTEPQCAQSHCPGFCLGSVCYNLLQIIYKCIWEWCEHVLHRAEIGAAVQGTQQMVLHDCGTVGCIRPLRCTCAGSQTKIFMMILFRTSLSAKMTHPATYQNIVTWTFAQMQAQAASLEIPLFLR